jgi:branched-chain amino acid transport system permease protein
MVKRLFFIHGPEVLVFVLLATIPLAVKNPFVLALLTLLAIYGILLIGLDVTVGYLGQVNLAQAAFLGLGAYTAGLTVNHFGIGMQSALFASLLVGLAFGALLAFPALRLEGPQFALATLSFSALSSTTLNEWESLTNGAQGLQITRPALFGLHLEAQGFFWFCLILLAMVWMAMRNLLTSQWGRTFEALRDSPIATDAMGVGTYRHKIAAFALGSALGGLAGGLYAFNFQYLQPQIFVWDMMVILLLGVVLGGRKNLWGAFVGAALIVLLPNLLSNRLLFRIISFAGLLIAVVAGGRSYIRKSTRPFQALAPVIAMSLLVAAAIFVRNIEDMRRAIFALILFSIVVGLPDGLMGFATRFFSKVFNMPPAPLPEAGPLDLVLGRKNPDGSPLLEIRELKRYFGGVQALDGVSLVVHSGQIHGLIGPNGSGKSTLVNVISGLYAPSGGTMLLRGRPLPAGSLYKAARMGISRTFQNLQIFSELTAMDNVMVAMKGEYNKSLLLVLLGLARGEERCAQSGALALLQMVGLRDKALTPAKDLPYGAQRFLEIARALACRPDLLILDEPAAGLAHPDVKKLVEIIRHIHRIGISTILIEHHMEVVSELCDMITVLDGGLVIAKGKPEDIKRNPAVIAAYLGVSA